MSEIVGAGKLEQKCLISEDYSKRKEEESKRVGAEVCKTGRLLQIKKKDRKTWLKQGKSICIIGMLSKKQRQIRTT